MELSAGNGEAKVKPTMTITFDPEKQATEVKWADMNPDMAFMIASLALEQIRVFREQAMMQAQMQAAQQQMQNNAMANQILRRR